MNNIADETYGNLRDLLNFVFKHKIKITSIFFSVVLLVTIYTLLVSPTYEASSKILVKFGRENIFKPTGASPEDRTRLLFDDAREERINSEVEILTGRHIIERVINDLGVNTLYPKIAKKSPANRPASGGLTAIEKAFLACDKNLSVDAIKKSSIINIKFQHKDPFIAAQFVNKLVSTFLEHHLKVYKDPAKYGFFDDQVNLQKKTLRDSEKKLEDFKKQNSISSLARQKDLLLNQISDLEVAHSKTTSEISRNEGELKSLKGSSSEVSKRKIMGEETELNPAAMSSIRTRLSELRLEEQALLANYTEQSMRVRHVRQEIEEAQNLLNQEEQIYHNKAITTLGHNLNALKSEAASQEKQLAAYQQKLNSVNSKERKLKELERQLEIDEENYQLYVKHLEEARIDNAMDTEKIANISVVEPALPPLKPVKPNKRLNVILSIILGVFAGFGAALLSDFFRHTFNNSEDIIKHLDLSAFASIPEFEPHNPVDFKLSPQVLEEFHRLKQNLITSQDDEKMKTILFSSSTKGEGTSTVISNFAITLATEGDKVLLVDVDLRKPSLHKLFNLDEKYGLTELFLGEKSLNEVIKQTSFKNLSVITSGTSHANPLVFEPQSLASFIEKVKTFFDWILFDCSSIHSCNDAISLAEKMDGIVMVVQAESTRWEVAHRAKERIEDNKIKVMGAVLNRREMYIPDWIYKRL